MDDMRDENREDMRREQGSNRGNKRSCVPNAGTVKGILAIIFGTLLIILAHNIVLKMIFFICGCLFVYYGLVVLKVKQVTDYIDTVVEKIRRRRRR